ncbi:MAG: hypothetical protein WCJ70_03815 [bacterium]
MTSSIFTKKINLFTAVEEQRAAATKKLRTFSVLCMRISMLLGLLLMFSFLIQIKLRSDNAQFASSLKSVEQRIESQFEHQLKMSVIDGRLAKIASASTSDIQYVSLHTRIYKLLSLAGVSLRMNKLTIEKQHQFTAEVEFLSSEDLRTYLTVVEGPEFQKKIKQFSVQDFRLNKPDAKNNSVTLSIGGTIL